MPERLPDLSVIVPSVNGWSDLEGAVAALLAQDGGLVVEVIVPERLGASVREPLRRRFPTVRLLEVDATSTIPAMRRIGFAAARADVVGVIEDHVLVPGDWAARMLEAQRAGAQVVGGSVGNAADQRWIDWAAFLCEYSHCLTPPTGPSPWVTGNNVTYRRELLERFGSVIAQGGWENRLHDALRDAGVTLLSRPDIRVGHKKHYTFGEYFGQRFLYARSFAGMRVAGSGAARRLGYAAASLALPPLLFSRIVSRVLSAGMHRRQLLVSLPLLFLFVTAWAAGEFVGYSAGHGDSLSRVR